MRRNRLPTYRRHSTGQGMVRIAGRSYYLGLHGRPESQEKYRRLLAEWIAAGQPDPWRRLEPGRISVSELIAAYLERGKVHFRKVDGTPTTSCRLAKAATRFVVDLFGSMPAAEFSPASFRACQGAMIQAGLCRNTINDYGKWIRRAFRWGVSESLIPGSTWHALLAVEELRPFRTAAPERPPIRPAALEHVRAVQAHVTERIAAMIDLQLLTGARPGEIASLRVSEIDFAQQPWIFRPAQHKTAYQGKVREIAFGPQARAILVRFLRPGVERPFPVSENGYCQSIRRACRKAGIPRWRPNQLRHLAATTFRAEFGLEVARALLGHSSSVTTEVYAERDRNAVLRAMERIG